MNIDILRMARGQDKHLVHFQCQRLSATSRRRGRISARHEEKAIKTKDEDLPDDSALKKVFETEAFSPSYPQETIIYPMRRLNQLRTGMSYNLKQINATKTQPA